MQLNLRNSKELRQILRFIFLSLKALSNLNLQFFVNLLARKKLAVWLKTKGFNFSFSLTIALHLRLAFSTDNISSQ